MRKVLIFFAAVLFVLMTGCISSGKYTHEHRPRSDQKRWPDEREVINTVVKIVNMSGYASLKPKALMEYALFLRRWYGTVSEGGNDVDAGIRALNYIKKIHNDAYGGGGLWREVLDKAKTEEDDGSGKRMPGLPPPVDYK